MKSGSTESPVKQALREILRLKEELARERDRRAEPIAIVGMGVRLPGDVDTPDAYWNLLVDGVDAVGPIPQDRWDHAAFYDPDTSAPDRYYVQNGGFLRQIDGFDPEFFGIAPVEAVTVDPQQRLLLETAWEALEHAGVPPQSLHGTRTGVFVGIAANDYQRMVLSDASSDTYAGTGTAASVAAGRLSYVLGLRGPAMALDTACSSSLVAVHLACQSLRSGESEAALAAGVNLMLTPALTINFCQAGMLSKRGQCRTFDAGADGYVRSEGCGVIVLKRLQDALRDGNRIHAVIRGSAVNQDGRSSGLTAPSGPSQERVLKDALGDAGLEPGDVSYVEAHGTGTSLGDPIELQALGAVFGDRPKGEPLLVGSAKTNLGHLEAAAGMAGLVKVALSLERGEIPPHLHFREPNPHIPWDELPVAIPTSRTPWPATRGLRRAGVSSFGFSGTNAHVILEEAPPSGAAADPGVARSAELMVLSAPRGDTLREVARRHVEHLGKPGLRWADTAWTSLSGRTHFPERLALVAEDGPGARAALEAWLNGESVGHLEAGSAPAPLGALALAFPPTHRVDAAAVRELARASVPFRASLERCDATLRENHGLPLLDLLEEWAADPSATPGEDLLQPVTFAIQWSLARFWIGLGVQPSVVVGGGVGEYVGAQIAGAFGLVEALALVVARGKGAERMAPGGGSRSSGSPEALELEEALAGVELRTPGRIQFVSGVTGTAVSAQAPAQPGYWLRQAREEPKFSPALEAALEQGVDLVISLDASGTVSGDASNGAHRVLQGGIAAPDPWGGVLATLARLYLKGLAPDARGLAADAGTASVTLPTYPFDRRRFWFEGRAGGPGTETPGRADPSPSPSPLPSPWEAAVAAGRDRAGLVPMGMDIHAYSGIWEVLNALTSVLGRNALAELGAFPEPGHEATLAQILDSTGILPTYARLVHRWLDGLVEGGELERTPSGYRSAARLEPMNTERAWTAFEEVVRHDPPLLTYIRHSGRLLAQVLSGRTSALETLFPDGSFDLAADLYHDSVMLRYVNGIGAAALAAHVATLPGDARIRVLEIGAGTGGTTARLLPVLPAERTEYRYTDVSDLFLDWARKRFGHVPFLRTGLFDLEGDPEAQGVEEGGWDVVVAANVVHAVRDLRDALGRLRSLLRPGGMLMLVESTGHHPWHDISTGLIEGWQHFEDDLRTDTPLLTPDVWARVLKEAGFVEVEALPGETSPAGVLKQHLLIASVAGDARTATLSAEGAPEASLEADPPRAQGADREPAAVAAGFLHELARAPEGAREDLAAAVVRECVMEVLRSDPDRPPARDARLMDLGLDSLMAVRLRNLLQERVELEDPLPATLVFDYPTIRHVARLIVERAQPKASGDSVRPTRDEARPDVRDLTDDEVEAMLLERLESEELT